MYIADSHIHSNFSGDCKEDLKNIFEFAIKNNINEITITDHLDPDFPSGVPFFIDIDKYISTLSKYRDLYQEKLKLNLGIEFGLQPHLLKEFNEISSLNELDFIIGSTHAANKMNPVEDDFFLGKTKDEAHEVYFKDTLSNARLFKDISVYGHLDFIKRYGKNINKDFSTINYKKHWDIIRDILKALINNNSGLEINTSAYRYGTSEPYPNDLILKEYKKLGGEIITIGSDSHIASHISKDFDKAYKLLKDCGFDYYATFNKRKPNFIKLDI